MKVGNEFYRILISGLDMHIVNYEVDYAEGDVVYLKSREILKIINIINISPKTFSTDRENEENIVSKRKDDVERYIKEDEKARRSIIELILY